MTKLMTNCYTKLIKLNKNSKNNNGDNDTNKYIYKIDYIH